MDNKVTRFLFWVAFVAFLCSSIPHVAWVFNQFEQGNGDMNLWGFRFNGWYCLSIMIAVSIDALVAWLSFQLAVGKGKGNARMIWGFILSLSALSWYCNWIYSVAHSPAAKINVWGIVLFWGWTTVGTFTSWLVSAFPVFSIGYTFMLSKMNENQLDPEQLRTELARKKMLADIRQEFARKESGLSSFLKRGIDEAVEITTFAKSKLGETKEPIIELKNGSDETALEADQGQFSLDVKMDIETAENGHDEPAFLDREMDIEGDKAADTGSLENGQSEEPEMDIDTDPEMDAVNITQFHQRRTPNGQKAPAKISGRRKSMSVAEAAAFLGCSDRQVRRLREQGTLVTDGKDRLTSASVRAHKKKKVAKLGLEGA